jgi:hypothetical protein
MAKVLTEGDLIPYGVYTFTGTTGTYADNMIVTDDKFKKA